ncbi:MAG: hypothetical protein H5T61_14630 [Thermoflexales bacterium]|nr:hypothetical protein [Thermoflexales bacterium]
MVPKWLALLSLVVLTMGCVLLPTSSPPAATSPPRASEDTGGLSGVYRVTGTNPDGRPYEGTLTIEAQGDVYALSWEIGDTVIEGVGLLRGNVLSGGWDCGVVTYSVLEDGTLEGLWALCGGSRVGTERAVPGQPGVQGESPYAPPSTPGDTNILRKGAQRGRQAGTG